MRRMLVRLSLATLLLVDAVAVPAQDRGADPAGWIEDPASGCRLWVAAALKAPPHRLQWAGDCIAHRVDGYGRARILAWDNDPAPLELTGHFRDGVFLGDTPYPNPVTPLAQDDALVELGSGGVLGQRIWFHRRLAEGVRVPLCDAPERLLVALPGHASRRDEDAIKRSLLQAATAYAKLCPGQSRVAVSALPFDHARAPGGEITAFLPELATAELQAAAPGEWSIALYRNEAAREEERRRNEEQARQPPRQTYDDYAAATKARFDAFGAEHKVVSWVKVEQIDANPFRWEGTVVAFRGEVRRMLSASTALIGGREGTGIVLSGVATDLFLEPATVVAAARIGTRQPVRLTDPQGGAREASLVTAALIAVRPCAAKACMDFFEWMGHDLDRFPWGGDPATFAPPR